MEYTFIIEFFHIHTWILYDAPAQQTIQLNRLPTWLHKVRLCSLSHLQLLCILEQIARLTTKRLDRILANLLPENNATARAIENRRIKLQVPIEEEGNAVAIPVRSEHTMTRAAIVPARVAIHSIANIDHVCVLLGRHRNPCLGRRVPHLKTLCAQFLKKDGDAAEIGVVGDCALFVSDMCLVSDAKCGLQFTSKLSVVADRLWPVVKHSHRDGGILSQHVERIGSAVPRLREAAAQNLEQDLDQVHHLRLVGHYGLAEVLVRDGFWPEVRPAGKSACIRMVCGNLRAYDECLDYYRQSKLLSGAFKKAFDGFVRQQNGGVKKCYTSFVSGSRPLW